MVYHCYKAFIAYSYLELDQFLWYKGLCSRKQLVTWSIFTEEMIAHYEDTKSNTFFRATPQQLEEKREKGLCYKEESKIMATRSLPLTIKKMEVLFLLAFHNLQGLHHNNWKKKEKKGFVTISITNNKYIKSHKCVEKKLFYIDYGEEEAKDQETSKEEYVHQEPTPEKEEIACPKLRSCFAIFLKI